MTGRRIAAALRAGLLAGSLAGLIAGPAPAQMSAGPFPAQYSVTGVADDDRLNIRAEPDASSPILDSYFPYAMNVEVLRTTPDGSWGLVGLPEGNGWVSMRYLAAQETDPAEIPRPLNCGGTEPFWSLNMTLRGDEYDSPGTGYRFLSLLSARTAPNGYLATFEEGPTLNRTLTVMRGACSDGMSDREYGWRAMLFNDAPDGSEVQAGCCTLDGNF
ncbi:SH3 domain-containing protein [Wenxinia saemankumensis]|uniref:SH3 domain-containing protein n=1 Tax=Wenxinia saemankumensis TaxID=1447782 RepID=A0A1M6FT24_9RHOB|nr:SH3 domain-containing protein [Wenxinia saemankumensis]SHJ00799.1 SH3 domain-containing protein [Wenxinia saemankumensis]